MLGNVVVKTILLLISLAHGETAAASPYDTANLQAAAAVTNQVWMEQAVAPGYAKWGRLAMEETAKAYEGASIIDYKYEGRTDRGHGLAEERFRLWLRQGEREFGVRVTISVEVASDTSRGVKFEEVRP